MQQAQDDYKKAFSNLKTILEEEKIYENVKQEDRLSLKQKIRKEKALKSKNKGGRKKILYNYKKVKFSNTSFGLKPALCKFMVILVITTITQFGTYTMLYPQSKRISNLMKVFVVTVDCWSTYDSAWTMVYDTFLLNNSIEIWRGKKTLDGYYYFKERTESSVIPRLTAALEYDLGNMTLGFQEALTKVPFFLKFNSRATHARPSSRMVRAMTISFAGNTSMAFSAQTTSTLFGAS